MKKGVSHVLIIVLILTIVCIQSPCYAQNMLRKLGRGTCNILTGALEIPKSVQEVFYDDGPAAAATYGIFDGVYKGIVRTVVGTFEVLTFPFPFPAEYAPIVNPEFLFMPDDPAGERF